MANFTKDELSLIMCLLQEEYRLAGSKGKSAEQIKRIARICNKITNTWVEAN